MGFDKSIIFIVTGIITGNDLVCLTFPYGLVPIYRSKLALFAEKILKLAKFWHYAVYVA